MTDWPPITRGLGKLTPDRWKRIGAAVGAVESLGELAGSELLHASTTLVQIVSSSVPAADDRLYSVKRAKLAPWTNGSAAWTVEELEIPARNLADVGLGAASGALPAGFRTRAWLVAGEWWMDTSTPGASGSAICTCTGGDKITAFQFSAPASGAFPAGTATNVWVYADIPASGTAATVLASAQTLIPVWADWISGAWVFRTHVVCPVSVAC